MNIICFSTQDFDEPMWTNKQHIMSRLAKTHNVVYVDINPLPYEELLIKKPWDLPLKIKQIKNLVQKRGNNLWVCTNFIFGFLTNFRESKLIEALLEKKMHERVIAVKNFIKKNNWKDIVLWIYWPPYEKFINEFDNAFVVYDCVDEYTAFPGYTSGRKHKEMKEAERNLLCKSNLVIASATNLYEEKKKFNPNTYLVHNVGDANHFAKAQKEETKEPKDIFCIKHPIIGFIGAVSSYKVNIPLLEKIAAQQPNWSLVIIGPVGASDPNTNISKLKSLKNVHFLGLKSYEILPYYIKAFDVCIIPYNINEYTINCFPIKFFEFMATGKPLVTTNLPALEQYKDIVKYAKTDEEFINYIKEVIVKDTKEKKEIRIKIAFENSWEKRINMILALIQQHNAKS